MTPDSPCCVVVLTPLQVTPFLSGKTLELLGFLESQQQDLSDWCNEAEGELVR